MWLLVFILFVNILLLVERPKASYDQIKAQKLEEETLRQEYSLTPEKLQILMKEKKEVVVGLNLFMLSVLFFLLVGLVLNIFFFFSKSKKAILFGSESKSFSISWDIWDVFKVAILFVFFGYILIIIESSLASIFPLMKEKEHVRMMVNSSILDVLAVVFVLYAVLVTYKENIKKIGLSVTNFFKNIFIGIAGYIAALPMIIGLLVFTIITMRLAGYEPPVEPILRLFLEEDNVLFLLYSVIFVCILGPIFEEIFFRGFMYAAFRKRVGIFRALLITSALFSVLHTNIMGFLPIMALGGLLAYLYEKTGSIVAPIVVHIIHNTGMMVFLFLIKEFKI